jgi:cyclophilin family peptidyl-prolyl cis-trans isomerase
MKKSVLLLALLVLLFACKQNKHNGKLSSACQFYIVQNKDGIHRLDDKYTVFGQVFKGMDIVDAIVSVKTDSMDSPLTPIKMDVNLINLSAKELKQYQCVSLSDSSDIFHK